MSLTSALSVVAPTAALIEDDALRGVGSLLDPQTLVVVGPSDRHPALIRNLLRGTVDTMGVHPTRAVVGGMRCVPRVSDLPVVPETAILAVGHRHVEAALQDLIEAGVRGIVLPGLGNEAGDEVSAVVERVTAIVAASDLAVLGQNCMGVARPGASAWIGTLPDTFLPGRVSVVAQSGSVAEAFSTLGPRIGFRSVVSTGSEMNRDAADFLAYFADDPGTGAVGLFLESVRRPQAFLRALDLCAQRDKPVVCLKVGRSRAAARVALAHTGALVGSGTSFSAVLRRFGALEVSDFQEMAELLEVLGAPRAVKGVRVAAVSESGGECGLLADAAEAHGLTFEPFPEAVAAGITERFPTLNRPQNPLDVWGVDLPEVVFPGTLEVLAASGSYDVLIGQVDLSAHRGSAENVWCEMVVRSLGGLADRYAVAPVVVSVASVDAPPHIAAAARECGVPLLRGISRALGVLSLLGSRRRPAPWSPAGKATRKPRLPGSGAMAEYDSALVLEEYGVPFGPRRRAASPQEAAEAAVTLGFPVVVKVDGPAHKASSGGVVLDLCTPAEVAAAARRLGPVLVARQVPAGLEVYCGMSRDSGFGAMFTVGFGGSDVEARTPAICMGPLDELTAGALVEQAALPAFVRPDLVRVLLGLSRLAAEHPEVVEIDVNPLIAGVDGLVAVDALIVIDAEEAP